MISSSIKVPTALTNGLGKSVEELIDGEAKITCQRNSDPAREASDLEWILRVPSNATKFTFKADGEPILTLNFEKATLE